MKGKDDPRKLLSEMLVELQQLARKRKDRTPNRYHARAVLLGLGELALAEPPEEGERAAAEWVPRLQRAMRPFDGGFERAIVEELALAAAEHARGVDPRFLDHPRYDFAYTIAARERLERRLVAAQLLGVEPDEALLERVAGADRLLEPYLEREERGAADEDAPGA